ncbi:helix-turn-helix domain-containing protein [Actinoplanes subtropicus]|uniref:helix-turn-helix domain-containing protein n=1 Tax=Actinoplanes subtropicus TaxID=543632 RepID=UPI001FDECB7D|nr:XRE family transcriptional regulator [Actinoplanes subtropicus]
MLFPLDEPAANPQLLVAAREALGLTQAELADRLSKLSGSSAKTNQSYVSRVEKGTLPLAVDRLQQFAAALESTPEFLIAEAKLWSLGEGCLYHRNRRSTKASTLRRLHAQINLVRLYLARLADASGTPLPTFAVSPTRVEGVVGPQTVAAQLRAQLGLADGAITSVTAVAERLGALVVPMPLGGREVDATSLHPPGEPPVFVVNTDAPIDRQRFTLTHELGHCVCTPGAGADAEEMAQAFAAEFLAPRALIYPDLTASAVTPARLLQLKAKWRISAAAVLRRSADLAVITDSRYRTISAQISALGWRTEEPDPLPAETPQLVPAIVRAAVQATGSVEAAASAAGTTPARLRSLFGDAVTDENSSRTGND